VRSDEGRKKANWAGSGAKQAYFNAPMQLGACTIGSKWITGQQGRYMCVRVGGSTIPWRLRLCRRRLDVKALHTGCR